MRKAGAIPLAVTNVSELCMWWESTNTVYGRTNNPYNTNHIVGGSSGGEVKHSSSNFINSDSSHYYVNIIVTKLIVFKSYKL